MRYKLTSVVALLGLLTKNKTKIHQKSNFIVMYNYDINGNFGRIEQDAEYFEGSARIDRTTSQ